LRRTNQAKKDAWFFDGATIAEKTDDKDKGACSNEKIGALRNNCRLSQILQRLNKFRMDKSHFIFGLNINLNVFLLCKLDEREKRVLISTQPNSDTQNSSSGPLIERRMRNDE